MLLKKELVYRLIAVRCKIVLCAGKPRSGSTWLFNIVRLLLSNTYGFTKGFFIDDFFPGKFLLDSKSSKFLILKIHAHDQFLVRHADIVLYSIRDLRDISASMHRMFGISWDNSIKKIDRHVTRYFPGYKHDADYIMRYEAMISSPESTVNELARLLKVETYDCNLILSEINKMSYFTTDNVNKKYNLDNLLHKGHITDGRYGSWKETMPVNYIKLIENKYSEWFKQNNYPINI